MCYPPSQSMFAAQMGILNITGGRKHKTVSKLDKKTMEKMRSMIDETNANSRSVNGDFGLSIFKTKVCIQ